MEKLISSGYSQKKNLTLSEEFDLSISLASHGQGILVNQILDDLRTHQVHVDTILTCNTFEEEAINIEGLNRVKRVDNLVRRGFSTNHNLAFQQISSNYFCITNPDIRLPVNPFPDLLEILKDPQVGVVAPLVLDENQVLQDSARIFPDPWNLALKLLRIYDGRVSLHSQKPTPVDWVGGMFMIFNSNAFREIGGFDEKYFLYYEDVDICARLWKSGYKVILHPGVNVVHSARRMSHKNIKYMYWHISSMLRYFRKHLGRLTFQK
jgi:N-acetylglucosaminyl-diphospho-decaprenol L-rhamnosyltransferase